MQHFETMIEPAILRAALIFAAKDDITRPYLQGVRIEADETGVKAISTDGHRAYVAQCDNVRTVPPVGFTLERETLEGALKLHGRQPMHIRIAYDRAEQPDPERPGVTVVSAAVVTIGQVQTADHAEKAGRFPEWRRIVPKECSGELAQFNAEYLADCAKARKLLGAGDKCPGLFLIHHNGQGPAAIPLRSDVLSILMPYRYSPEEYSEPEWINAKIPMEEEQKAA